MNATQGLPWHIVESAILREKKWLKSVLDFGPFQKEDFIHLPSSDEMLRQVSASIISGKISARELKSVRPNGLWADESSEWEHDGSTGERHGGEWHRMVVALIKKYFLEIGFEVVNEPFLSQGRADLGVYKVGYPNLYVEAGTTSLFKVWLNTHVMPHSIFLFIPNETTAIELTTK